MQKIRFIRFCLLACLTALLLQGCGVPLTAEQFKQTPEAGYLQETMDQLAAQDYAALEAAFDPKIRQPDMRQALQHMAAILPPGRPVQVNPVAWNFFSKTNRNGSGVTERTANIAAEYGYAGQKWLLVSEQLSGEPGNFHILGFHINPLTASLTETNTFSFRGKGLKHYVFMLLACLTFLLMLFAFVSCLRLKGLKRKWLWAIFTLFTVSLFTLDWTSGEIGLNWIRVNLVGWGVVRSGWLGPWLVMFPMPIGAIIFLWKFWPVIRSRGKTVAS